MLYIRHSITGSNFSGGRRGRDCIVTSNYWKKIHKLKIWFGLVYGVYRHFQQYCSISQRKQTPLHGKMLYIRHSITGSNFSGGRRGRDCIVVGYTTTCAISAYHH
jgi:hypothetical protein